MRFPGWRHYSGPLLTVALSAVAVVVHRYVIPIPAPGSLSFLAVLYAAFVGGVFPGLISAIIAILFGLALHSTPQALLTYDDAGLFRLFFMSMVLLAVASLIGGLRARSWRLLAVERASRTRVEAANVQLLRLHGALDRVDHGVVLLDEEMRAEFMNRTYCRMFNVPPERAAARPSIAQMLNAARDAGAFAMSRAEADDFIARRLAQLDAGDERPVYLRLTNGKVIRVQSTKLPEGGWMGSFNDVTDLVAQADAMARLAATDELTDMFNRRHFQTVGTATFERARREHRPLAMLMIDIDHFKSINDRFGHAAGDEVIRHVARLCRSEMTPTGIAARFGGDEFVLLLPDMGPEAARALAERLRRLVAIPDPQFGIATVSVGVATMQPLMANLDDLAKQADRALYEAKHGSRDCVAVAGPERSAA